jgi:hypothetical protein
MTQSATGTNGPTVPAPNDDDECGSVGEMRIVAINPSTRRKPARLPLRPPQIPHDVAPGHPRWETGDYK